MRPRKHRRLRHWRHPGTALSYARSCSPPPFIQQIWPQHGVSSGGKGVFTQAEHRVGAPFTVNATVWAHRTLALALMAVPVDSEARITLLRTVHGIRHFTPAGVFWRETGPSRPLHYQLRGADRASSCWQAARTSRPQ